MLSLKFIPTFGGGRSVCCCSFHNVIWAVTIRISKKKIHVYSFTQAMSSSESVVVRLQEAEDDLQGSVQDGAGACYARRVIPPKSCYI